MIRSAFYGVMLGILILQNSIQEKLRGLIKDLPIILIMMKLNFLLKKKIFIMYLAMRISWFFQFIFLIKNLKDLLSMDLLLLIKDNKSHYVYIKDFNRFMFHKTKNKNKKWFCKNCLQCFSSENILIKHKKDCLSINGVQSVKVKEGVIKVENYFKQLPVPFKIYADFECNLKNVEIYEGSYTKNIIIIFLVVMLIRLSVLMIDLVSRLLFIEVKMLLMNLLKQFLKSISIVKK